MIPSSLNPTSGIAHCGATSAAKLTNSAFIVGLLNFGIPFHFVAANTPTLLRLQLTKKKMVLDSD